MDTWVSSTIRLWMYFFGGLQAWEERTAFTEIDYIVHYNLDQSNPKFDTLFSNKPYFAVLLSLPP